MPIADRVAKVFHQVFRVSSDDFSLETTPEKVPHWDSIGHMNLIAQLEEEFGRQFELDEIMEMSSAGKIVEILRAKGIKD
jgi:acyl carrier protein